MLLAASWSTSAVAEDEEWERDLPRGDGARIRVVDGRTGRAVPNARLRHFAEVVSELQPGHREILAAASAPLLRVFRTDEYGVAWIDWERWVRGGHWIVDAPGYAPTHEWGDSVGPVVELLPPRTLDFRLLDAAGRPVPGAVVEAYLGCPHAPALVRVRSDGEGRVRMENGPPGDAFLWVEAEGSFAWTPGFPPARTWVRGERALVLSAGTVAEGVVVDLDGTPLAGVVVRGLPEERGPAQLTGEDGRFRIVGLTRGSGLEFVHPAGERVPSILEGDRWTPGVPRRVALTPWEVAEPGGPRRLVRVRVAREDGTPVDGVPVRLVREEDGWTLAEPTDDDPPDAEVGDEEDAGEALFLLPHGTYVLDRPTAFGSHEITDVRFAVGAGDGEVFVPVRATTRPRLTVRGDIPAGATVTLAIAGAERELEPEEISGAEPVHLPADATAALRVRAGDGTWFFEVGPATVGVRTAVVEVPRPHVLRGIDRADWESVVLRDEFGECGHVETSDGLATWACGDLTLRLTAPRRGAAEDWPAYDVTVRVPTGGTDPIDVAVPSVEERRARDAVVSIVAPDADWEGSFEVSDETGEEVTRGETVPGAPFRFALRGRAWVLAEREGWAPLRAEFAAPGDLQLRWGDAAVSLTVRDEDGAPVAAALLLDGWISTVPEDPADPVVLRGLAAGPVDLVVLPNVGAFRPKALRLVLRRGETRTREVVLARR